MNIVKVPGKADWRFHYSMPCCRRRRLEECERSKVVDKLLNMVGRGQVSVTCAVDLSHCAMEDGLQNSAVHSLSSLGNHGQCPSNYERDLHTSLRNLYGFELAPYIVPMTLQATWFVSHNLL